mmetsp:Transcript_26020/g.104093  ORF Transcript_26020/g.104093 Transcript_26020/m.104093 type:complete len:87 (-) Transcript_26020:35-295(-)
MVGAEDACFSGENPGENRYALVKSPGTNEKRGVVARSGECRLRLWSTVRRRELYTLRSKDEGFLKMAQPTENNRHQVDVLPPKDIT